MSRRRRNLVRTLIFLAVCASVWLISTEPWGLGVYQLVMFAAPGALLGLGASWMAHGSAQWEWTWRTARRAAMIGAATLPPVLAFIVALDGNARPQRLLVGFVYAAWAALIGGAAVALLRQPSGTHAVVLHAERKPARAIALFSARSHRTIASTTPDSPLHSTEMVAPEERIRERHGAL